MADKQALVDSGATDNFMHPNFAKRMGLGMKTLPVMIHAPMIWMLISFRYLLRSQTPHPVTHYDVS
jgi:hypothetical protein